MNGKFTKGDRVKHASQTAWGLGEVLADPTVDRVHVLFEDVGDKIFKIGAAEFIKVVGEEAKSEYLTALVQHFAKGKAGPKTSFALAVKTFLQWFPGGFKDEAYLSGKRSEREYKVAAHDLMVESLGREPLGELIAAGDYSRVCDRAKSVVKKTNMIFHYQQYWLDKGLSSEANQRAFAEALNR